MANEMRVGITGLLAGVNQTLQGTAAAADRVLQMATLGQSGQPLARLGLYDPCDPYNLKTQAGTLFAITPFALYSAGATVAGAMDGLYVGFNTLRTADLTDILVRLRGEPGLPAMADTFSGSSGLSAGQAGSYGSLRNLATVGDKLTPHHMPQAALGFTSYDEGGAIALEQWEHVATRTYGIGGVRLRSEEAGVSFRTVLSRDINDLRRVVGNKYDQGIRDLLEYYRVNFPDLMRKP